jgi:hypothetical protein
MKMGFRRNRTSRYRKLVIAARQAVLSFYLQAAAERPDTHL